MWIEKNGVPNVNFFTSGQLYYSNIIRAYNDLKESYQGICDFIMIMDFIFEGNYSLSEAMVAGVLITDAREGYLKKGRSYLKKGRYLRINDCDVFFDDSSEIILSGHKLNGCIFEDSRTGELFKMKTLALCGRS